MIVFLFACFCFTWQTQSQNIQSRFQHITTDDGLAQNMVDCMLQDSQGFMWFGTWNGLCKYDGYEFEYFNDNADDAHNLRSNFIYALHEDQFGNIWIGTGNGLYLYIYDRQKFIHIESELIEPESDYRVIEPYGVNRLLICSNESVFLFAPKDASGEYEAVKKVSIKQLLGDKGSINAILGTANSKIWLGTDEGLYVFNASFEIDSSLNRETILPPTLHSGKVMALLESATHEIWVGTEHGLYRYSYLKEHFEDYFKNTYAPQQSLPHSSIMDIIEHESGNFVIGTLGGLSFFDSRKNQFSNYVHDQNNIHGLTNNFINCLTYDHDGNLWVGTERGGVNLLSKEQNSLEEFTHELNNSNSLNNATVNSILEDERYIWIGTAGGGLNRFDKKARRYNHFTNDPQNVSSISSNFITAIRKDFENNLWVGTWGSGVNILNARKEAEGFNKMNTGNSALASQYISSIITDSYGNVWIGTLGGISVYSRLKKNVDIEAVRVASEVTRVGCLVFDDEGNLWAGTQGGLYRIEIQGDQVVDVKGFFHDPKYEESLSGDYIISLAKDHEGNIWAGSYGQGLNKISVKDKNLSIDKYNTNDGLSNNIIYGIVEDDNYKLWLSTDYGLVYFDPETLNVRNLFRSDGLLNNQYYWSAAYKNKQGKLYFGGMLGLNSFNPDEIKEVHASPKVVITDLKLIGGSVIPGKEYSNEVVLDQSVSRTDEINLSYKERMLSIEFSTLNFISPELINYAYKLDGFDKKWNYMHSSRNYASYTNLKPGRYTFLVKAAGTDGIYTDEPTSLIININPPFWDTLWFRVSSALAIILIVIGYVRFRTLQLKRQKVELEKQVQQRTREINEQKEALSYQAIQLKQNNSDLESKQKQIEGQNDLLEQQNKEILNQRDELIELNKRVKLVSQLKLGFFTNISHEFRTPLTLILGPLERLLKRNQLSDEIKSSLELMNRNAQRLLHLINQIMDFRKIEKGKMELRVGRGDVGSFCKEIYNTFQPLASIKEIQYDITIDQLPEEVWFDKQKMENILYNLLSNAFKYTPHGGHIKVEVSAIQGSESKLKNIGIDINGGQNVISVKVIDSGAGISEENLPLIFKRFYRIESENAFKISGSGVGLALTEELIKTHHGNIFVSSELGLGSVFEIQFPCLKGAYELHEIGEVSYEHNIINQVELLKSEFLVQEEVDNQVIGDFALDNGKRNILVVEDNHDLRKFITHRLGDIYNVIEAGNGVKGLEFAEKYNPDIIVSDVMMPEMDGLELCASIKNNFNTSHIPVILLTAKASVENQIEGIQIGADDYLPKPFNFDLLEVKIATILTNRDRVKMQYITDKNTDVKQLASNNKDLRFLEAAIKVVNEQMSNSEFGSKDLVLSMGISRSLLHKKLTSLTNQSAVEFINQIRMKKAKELLCTDGMNISEVAYAVGYNDPKYFSRLFSKFFNEPPKEYQKRMFDHLGSE